MSDSANARQRVRTAVIWDALQAALDLSAQRSGRRELDILDVGGGTGRFAVPLAVLGHRVAVLEPSPDALAGLDRRAAEADVADRVRGVQADATQLAAAFDPSSFDVVLCHGVLEHVEEAAAVVAAAVALLRPGGVFSVLVANRYGAVLARAVAGRLDQAHRALADPAGRWGDRDPLPRRFTPAELPALLEPAGLTIEAVHGIRVCSDLVPAELVDGDPAREQELVDLEAALAGHPAFLGVATQLHALARRR